ncbi:MAG TPA: OpgC domain-containing protein, partial [Xanthobacteraceae bacterium]|nr:OpgC domain-containing protein [Xanthobacteraceae bacterium]
LYIILLLLFPPILWLLQFRSSLALGASVLLYVLTWHFNWNMPSYPSGHWYFNPFAWQLLFVFGAWCALGGAQRLSTVLQSPVTLSVAAVYLLFAFVISLTWYLPGMSQYVPHWLEEVIYPIDKVNLDVLRFAHFLALAVLTVRFVPRDWPFLKSWWAWPPIVCGQHSLEIFCLGVFLSFAAHFAMVEVSGAVWMQFLVSGLGIVVMIAVACLITWYKRAEGRSPGSRSRKTPDADLAGGEA